MIARFQLDHTSLRFISRPVSPREKMSKARFLVEPLFAMALSLGLVFIAACAAGIDPLVASSYGRADSGHYISIATGGYEFFSCARLGNDPTQWCGNAGWFPGYPFLIRLLLLLHVPPDPAGVLISTVFLFGAFVLLRVMLEANGPNPQNSLCYLLCTVFPGGVYYHAIFPISCLVFFATATILLASRQHYLWAAAAAACASFIYPTGFLLGGVVGLGVLLTSPSPLWRRAAEAAFYGFISVLGLIAVLLFHQFDLGLWNAFFLTQAKYGYGIRSPLYQYDDAWSHLATSFGNQEAFVHRVQSLMMGVVTCALLVVYLLRIRRATVIESLTAAQVGAFLLFPLISGPATMTRVEANLLPMVLLAAPLTRSALGVLLILFSFVFFEVAVAFFKTVLV
jgi:hypothetical protein